MKKTICTFLLATSLIHLVYSQVKTARPLEGVVSNKSILIQAIDTKKIFVERFTMFFKIEQAYQEPTMGMVLKANIDLDQALAREITNESYSYFKEAFFKKGLAIETYDESVFKEINDIKKAEKKGNSWLLNGNVMDEVDEKSGVKYFAVHAQGVNYSPLLRPTLIGTFDTVVAGTVSFIEVVDFCDPAGPNKKGKYPGIPNMAPSLMLTPHETICGTGGFGFWNAKLKGGSVSFPVNADIKWEGTTWLSSAKNNDEPNAQDWILNKEEYKKAVLDLSKTLIDQYIEEYLKGITPIQSK